MSGDCERDLGLPQLECRTSMNELAGLYRTRTRTYSMTVDDDTGVSRSFHGAIEEPNKFLTGQEGLKLGFPQQIVGVVQIERDTTRHVNCIRKRVRIGHCSTC